MDVTVDAAGNLYVADNGNDVIRKITPLGGVTTIAGTGAPGSINGPNLLATFVDIHGIAVDAAGNVYVTEGYSKIRKIVPEK